MGVEVVSQYAPRLEKKEIIGLLVALLQQRLCLVSLSFHPVEKFAFGCQGEALEPLYFVHLSLQKEFDFILIEYHVVAEVGHYVFEEDLQLL